jgi:heptaprenyl diphosphate synthase
MSSAERGRGVILTGTMLALACVLGLVEAALLPELPVPGVRLGLANIAVVVTAWAVGLRWALAVAAGRVVIVGLYAGTLGGPTFLLAASGALAAWCCYALLSRFGRVFSPVGWSVAGAAAHVCAQYAVMASIAGAPAVLTLLPAALAVSVLPGLATGLLSNTILSRLRIPTPLVGDRRAWGVWD